MKITVNIYEKATKGQVLAVLESVVDQIRAGYISGTIDPETNWEAEGYTW